MFIISSAVFHIVISGDISSSFFSSNFVDWRQMGLRLLIESFFIAFSS